MKFVIVSDNHGRMEVLNRIVAAHPDADAYFHLGDSELPPEKLRPFVSVKGNNDMYYDFPELRVLNFGDFKVLLIHGHQFYTFKRVEQIIHKAHQLGCMIACYGHTHSFYTQNAQGVFLINPGSVYYNRDGTRPSYAVATVEGKKVSVERVEC